MMQLVYKDNFVYYSPTTLEKLTITVNLITMAAYERHHYDKELLAKTGAY